MRKIVNITDETAQKFINEVLWCGLFCRKSDLQNIIDENHLSLPGYENYPKEGYHITYLWNGKKQITDLEDIKELINALMRSKTVPVVGYGDDGYNNGFEVQIDSNGYLGATTPHITWSWVNGSSPVKTVNLNFRPIPAAEIPVLGRVITRDGRNMAIKEWLGNE